jgi:hypothetical protein
LNDVPNEYEKCELQELEDASVQTSLWRSFKAIEVIESTNDPPVLAEQFIDF